MPRPRNRSWPSNDGRCGDTGGQKEDARTDAVTAVECDAKAAVERANFFDVALDKDLDAEVAGLLEGALGEFVPGDAGGKAEVIFDARGGAGLAAGGETFDDQDLEAFGSAVNGGGHAGRTSARDEEIVLTVFGDGLEAESFGDAADGGIFQRRSIDRDGDRGLRTGFRVRGTPIVGDAVGGKEGADGAAAGVEGGAGDFNAGGRRFANDLLRDTGPAGHGLEDEFRGGRAVANQLLQLLGLKTSGAAACEGAEGNGVAGTEKDGNLAGKIAGGGVAQLMALTEEVFEHDELAFEDDEEAGLFAFAEEPVAGLDGNVRRQSRESLPLRLFYTGKDGDFFQVFGSDHGACVRIPKMERDEPCASSRGRGTHGPGWWWEGLVLSFRSFSELALIELGVDPGLGQ